MNRRIVIVIVVAAALVCAGAAGLGLWLFNRSKDAGVVSGVAETYLEAVEDGDYSAAYGFLCGGFQQRWTREEYLELQRTQPDWFRHELKHISKRLVAGQDVWRFEYRIFAADGQALNWIIWVVKDKGAWRICEPGL